MLPFFILFVSLSLVPMFFPITLIQETFYFLFAFMILAVVITTTPSFVMWYSLFMRVFCAVG